MIRLIKKILGGQVRQKTLFQSLSANIWNFISNIGIQLFGVPILLTAFKADQYGEYLALSALPTFLFYADLGLGVSLSNEMTLSYSAGKKKIAQVYASTLIVFTSLLITGILLIGSLCLFISIKKILGLQLYNTGYYTVTFMLLLSLALGNNITGVVAFFLRALNKNGLGVNLITIQRVIVVVVIWIAALTTKDMLKTALIALAIEMVVMFWIIFFYKKNFSHQLEWKFSGYSFKLLFSSIKPGVSYLLFPIGMSLMNQGVIILLSRYLGSTSVVVFNATRTLSNFARQAISLINNSIWPEITVAFGSKNFSKVKKIFNRSLLASTSFTVVIIIFLLILGRSIFSIWLSNKVEFNVDFYFLMLLSTCFYSIWSTASILPSSINKFTYIGGVFFITNFVVFLVLYFLFKKGFTTYVVLAAGLLIAEILLVILIYPYSRKILNKICFGVSTIK